MGMFRNSVPPCGRRFFFRSRGLAGDQPQPARVVELANGQRHGHRPTQVAACLTWLLGVE
jgi:hypothetical protein